MNSVSIPDVSTKAVCNAADLADGQVKSISALGTELVAFRGADGKAGLGSLMQLVSMGWVLRRVDNSGSWVRIKWLMVPFLTA